MTIQKIIRYYLIDKEYIKRICFNCKTNISVFDYLMINTNISFIRNSILNILMNIWNSKHIQLYCCNCFKLKVISYRNTLTELLIGKLFSN